MIRVPVMRERILVTLALLAAGWIGGAIGVVMLDPRVADDVAAVAGRRPGDRSRIEALNLGHATARFDGVLVDTHNAPAVVLGRGRARGLLAPESEGFKLTTLFGRINASFVAVPDPHSTTGFNDRLNKIFPKLYRYGAPGYRLVYQNSTWRLFEHVERAAVAND